MHGMRGMTLTGRGFSCLRLPLACLLQGWQVGDQVRAWYMIRARSAALPSGSSEALWCALTSSRVGFHLGCALGSQGAPSILM